MPKAIEAAEKALKDFPADDGAAKKAWTAREAAPAPRRAGQAATPSQFAGWQDAGRREEPRTRREELPRADLLPDGRHRRPAAHPDALLHHAVGE
jgi:hypothetical protein